jgi:hypothetical protein
LLRLREPTGHSFADVVAVEFNLPTRTIGWCSGEQRLNGLSVHLNGIDPYLWSNDIVFVSLSGTPLPDGPGKARVIVRDASGEYGMLEITAAIQRMVPNAQANRPAPTGHYWRCAYKETPG